MESWSTYATSLAVWMGSRCATRQTPVPTLIVFVTAALAAVTDRPYAGAWNDGSRLATGSSDNTARLWDARSGLILQEFNGHTSGVASVALSEDGMEQAGMGVGIGDYNLDGHLDLFKTHFIGDTSGFYRNNGKGEFDDVTRSVKVGVETRYTSWGTGIADFDNDGHPDVLIVTGSVYPEVEAKLPQYPYRTPRVLFRNLGDGTFEELPTQGGPGISTPHSSRGCAFGACTPIRDPCGRAICSSRCPASGRTRSGRPPAARPAGHRST